MLCTWCTLQYVKNIYALWCLDRCISHVYISLMVCRKGHYCNCEKWHARRCTLPLNKHSLDPFPLSRQYSWDLHQYVAMYSQMASVLGPNDFKFCKTLKWSLFCVLMTVFVRLVGLWDKATKHPQMCLVVGFKSYSGNCVTLQRRIQGCFQGFQKPVRLLLAGISMYQSYNVYASL